jgi:hypothetical protein
MILTHQFFTASTGKKVFCLKVLSSGMDQAEIRLIR